MMGGVLLHFSWSEIWDFHLKKGGIRNVFQDPDHQSSLFPTTNH